MKMSSGGSIRRDLGRLFDGQSVVGLGEAQLLDRFVDRRDPSAFEALVAQHGPMVLGVCRRLLADPLDVEDAFQATFLVFVRRAGSIQGRDRLAPWLFGVARKVANRTRTDVARRKARESSRAEEFAEARNSHDRELYQVLLEEIDRLPISLREPILLCCVEGLSYEDAATRMQSTAPAVRGRLARGRERLRERLTRRGFAPSVVGAGGLLAGGAVRAAVPATLLLKTTFPLKTAGAFPSGVVILAEGVLRTMIATKTKFLAAALLACGVAGSGAGVYAQKQRTDQLEQASAPASIPAAAPTPSPTPDLDPWTDEPAKPKFLESRVERPQSQNVVTEVSTDGGKTWTRQPVTTAVITRRANVVTEDVEGVEPPPPAQNPDADRLGQLEKKLDRVLEALERSSPPTPRPARTTPGQPDLPAPPTVPALPARGTDVGSRDVAVDPVTGRPVGVRPAATAPRTSTTVGSDRRFAYIPTANPAAQGAVAESRIDALEQRIRRLEDAVKSLDRKVQDLQRKGSSLNPPDEDPDDLPPPTRRRTPPTRSSISDDEMVKPGPVPPIPPTVAEPDDVDPPSKKPIPRPAVAIPETETDSAPVPPTPPQAPRPTSSN